MHLFRRMKSIIIAIDLENLPVAILGILIVLATTLANSTGISMTNGRKPNWQREQSERLEHTLLNLLLEGIVVLSDTTGHTIGILDITVDITGGIVIRGTTGVIIAITDTGD